MTNIGYCDALPCWQQAGQCELHKQTLSETPEDEFHLKAPSSQDFPLVTLPRLFAFLSPQEVTQATSVCTQWQQGVIAFATPSCGPKHDHIVLGRIAVPRKIASFPPSFGFTDEQIKGLFSSKTKTLWQKVCEAEKTSSGSGKIPLSILQKNVEKDILSSPLPLTDAQRKKLAGFAGKTLIIRSSSNEDTHVINAGGNESVQDVAATEEGVRKALAKVIASYFSKKSFNNRSAFENPFREMPACSALVMVQITGDIVSGVMVTHKAAWFRKEEERIPHIVAARGFGAGTSGKIATDEWVLTKDRTYSMIRGKTPCLQEAQLRRLQLAGLYLERYFQNPRDVEFVFHRKELDIVQDRDAKAPEMSNPTFLDCNAVPKHAKCFQSISLISGESEVLRSLPRNNVLFARDFNHAVEIYKPGLHKVVVIYTPPASANTHEEMNFSGQKPSPIPCFLLPYEEWKNCQESSRDTPLHLCPQSGLIVVTQEDLAIRKGLFLHPARFSISAEGPAGLSTHPGIERLKSLLTTTAEELPSRLNKIEGELTQLFADIFKRNAFQMSPRLQQVARHLQEVSENVFRAMGGAAKQNHLTLLSFHSKLLRQLLQNNISGLEVATTLPACIELFLKTPRDSVSCELALFAKKAWDEPLQHKWLTFLEKNYSEALLTRLQHLDALGMLPMWFSIYFSGNDEPSMEALLTPEAGEKEFLDFACEWRQLKERVKEINTRAELEATWETLQKHTDAYLAFCSKFSRGRTLFQSLQLSKLSYDLIQLWDAQIKIVITTQLLPESEVEIEFNQRIDLFAQFGLMAIEHRAIAEDTAYSGELKQVLKECQSFSPHYVDRQFSVQHWIVPRSDFALPLRSNEERQTVVHQNLLHASTLGFKEDYLSLLPKPLAGAVRSFKRYATKDRRWSASISILEESAAVTFNIPLNLHSFVVTIQHNKGCDQKVEFNGCWRGFDNDQGAHLEFIQVFSSITGISLKSYSDKKPDLQVVLETTHWQQNPLVSEMIDRVNVMSVSTINHFNALVGLLTSKGGEKEDAEMRIKDSIWKQFTNTGTVPGFVNYRMNDLFDREYLEKQGHLSMVIARVMDEVEGRRPESLYSRRFFETVLGTLSTATEQKDLILRAVFQDLTYFKIPTPFQNEILAQLYREAPLQVLKYFARTFEMSKFDSFMQTVGSPTTLEQAKLHYCYGQLKTRGGIHSTFVTPLLESWDTLEFTEE